MRLHSRTECTYLNRVLRTSFVSIGKIPRSHWGRWRDNCEYSGHLVANLVDDGDADGTDIDLDAEYSGQTRAQATPNTTAKS